MFYPWRKGFRHGKNVLHVYKMFYTWKKYFICRGNVSCVKKVLYVEKCFFFTWRIFDVENTYLLF